MNPSTPKTIANRLTCGGIFITYFSAIITTAPN